MDKKVAEKRFIFDQNIYEIQMFISEKNYCVKIFKHGKTLDKTE